MIRKAKMSDAKEIQKLINSYADNNEMLPRAIIQIYEELQNFYVVELGGKIVGCCELFTTWENLAEIKALAVEQSHKGKGFGSALVKKCVLVAKQLGVKKVFALTFKVGFFQKMGFKIVSKDILPHKIWFECVKCPLFPDCNEIPVMKEIV
mgnify:CR=1 FL=1